MIFGKKIPPVAKTSKDRGDAGVRTHPDADDSELGDAALLEDFAGTALRADPLDHRADFYQFLGCVDPGSKNPKPPAISTAPPAQGKTGK